MKIQFLYGVFIDQDCTYSINEYGHLYSWNKFHKNKRTANPIRIKEFIDRKGYYQYNYSISGKRITIKAHILVMEHFVGPRPEGLVIRHLDGDPSNNHISNLTYGTHKENAQDSIKHGTRATRNNASLTDQEVIDVLSLLKSGQNCSDISRDIGISRKIISDIKLNKSYKHITR